MKKILFLLLCTVQIYGQTSTGQEQEFDYGIKNNSLQTITTPPYLTTTGMDGTQGKIPSALIAKTADIADSLATKENIANKSDSYTTSSSITYASTKALVDGLATKQNTLTNPITGTGTTNTIPKFTASGTVGNSSIFDNGRVMINTVVDDGVNNLQVNGTIRSSGSLRIGASLLGFGFFSVNNTMTIDNEISLEKSGAGLLWGRGSFTHQIFYANSLQRLIVNMNGISSTALTLSTTPTTSAGTYDILTRNTSTGVVEKVLSSSVATVASPNFTGTPTAPTAAAGTNTTQIATTAFVSNANSGNVTLTGNQSIAGNKTLSGTTTLNETIIREGYKLKFPNGVMYQSSVGTNALTDNRTVSFPDASGTVALVETVKPYKVYTALLSQTGTSAPTANVLENTLGGTVVWTRSSTGLYNGTLTGIFTASKTVFFINQGNGASRLSGYRPDTNTVQVVSMNAYLNEFADNSINNASIEIRVYL